MLKRDKLVIYKKRNPQFPINLSNMLIVLIFQVSYCIATSRIVRDDLFIYCFIDFDFEKFPRLEEMFKGG